MKSIAARDPSAGRTRKTVTLLVVGFGALYLLTAQRGISWGDSGFFQRRIIDHDLSGDAELGLAIAHPLFVWTAGLFSQMFPPALRVWAMNAVCGVWAALAAGMAFLCAKRFSKSCPAAILAAVTLGCSHRTGGQTVDGGDRGGSFHHSPAAGSGH